MKFKTASGAQYIFVDGQLTRLAEHPIVNRGGDPITPDMVWEVPATLVVPEEVTIGSRAVFRTIHGPLHTTEVTEVTE